MARRAPRVESRGGGGSACQPPLAPPTLAHPTRARAQHRSLLSTGTPASVVHIYSPRPRPSGARSNIGRRSSWTWTGNASTKPPLSSYDARPPSARVSIPLLSGNSQLPVSVPPTVRRPFCQPVEALGAVSTTCLPHSDCRLGCSARASIARLSAEYSRSPARDSPRPQPQLSRHSSPTQSVYVLCVHLHSSTQLQRARQHPSALRGELPLTFSKLGLNHLQQRRPPRTLRAARGYVC